MAGRSLSGSTSRADAAVAKKPAVAYRIDGVTLDRETWSKRSPEIEQERKVAIYDLLGENHFEPKGSPGGP